MVRQRDRLADDRVTVLDERTSIAEPVGCGGDDDQVEGDNLEYHDFVQVLGGTTYILRRADLPDPIEGLRSELMREHIERGVATLLLRVGSEGWQPVGPIDANSLWLNDQVAYERRRGNFLSLK